VHGSLVANPPTTSPRTELAPRWAANRVLLHDDSRRLRHPPERGDEPNRLQPSPYLRIPFSGCGLRIRRSSDTPSTGIATRLDRRLHPADVPVLAGDSYRLRQSQPATAARRRKKCPPRGVVEPGIQFRTLYPPPGSNFTWTPDTPWRASIQHQPLAQRLCKAPIPLSRVEAARLWASRRRLGRPSEVPPLPRVRSFAYLQPPIQELPENPIADGSLGYLRLQLRSIVDKTIHLIGVGSRGERGALLDEVFHPGRHRRLRQVDVTGFASPGNGMRPCFLAAIRLDRDRPYSAAGDSRLRVRVSYLEFTRAAF
jgi:hypothetical protein